MNDADNAPESESKKPDAAADNRIIDSSVDQSDPRTSYPMKSRKSKKASIVITLALVGLIIGIAASILSERNQELVDTKKRTDAATPTHFDSTQKLIGLATSPLKGQIIEAATTDGLGGKTANGYAIYSVPTYKVDNRKYENFPTSSEGSAYKGDSVVASANYTELNNFFKANKFKQLSSGSDSNGTISWAGNDVKYISYATYESNDLLCMIWHVDASATPIASHLTSIGCGEKSSYETAAKALDQYYDAYMMDNSAPSNKIVLGNARSGDSNGKDYKVAIVYLEDPTISDLQLEALYYKANGASKWTYFSPTHGWLDCPLFDTDALKKAFDGFNCYDKVSDKIINVGTGTLSPTLNS